MAEEHWVRYGVTARRKRNVRRMSDLQALRQTRREHRRVTGKALMNAAETDRSGTLVIEANDIAKAYEARPIVKNFSIRIYRGDRIGIVGPNGSGKTTLLNLLTGALAPDTGSVRLGANLDMSALDQERDSLNPDWTLSEALTGGKGDTVTIGGEQRHVVGYMKDFLFTPEQIRTPLHALSGGERGRVMLARALAKPSNLLVLDEPTNDLDLETLDVLEETLGAYAGTVILISHDRDFLDRSVNAVIAPEGEGEWTEYAGGYSDMLAQRGKDIAVRKSLRPNPIKQARPARQASAPPPVKRRLSFNEKYALEKLAAGNRNARDQGQDAAGPARRSGTLCARPQCVRRDVQSARFRPVRTFGGGRKMAGAGSVARGDREGLRAPRGKLHGRDWSRTRP